MKKIFLAACLFVTTLSANAQREVGTFSIIPRLGVDIANLSNEAIYYSGNAASIVDENKGKYKAGLRAGVDFDYQVLPKLSVSAGVFYSQRGCRYSDNEILISDKDNRYSGINDWNTDLQYLDVPIVANVYLAKNLAFKAGVQFGFSLGDGNVEYTETEFVKKEDGSKEYAESQKHKFDVATNKLDIAIPVGFSYEYDNVILDARYNFGLCDTFKKPLSQGQKNKSFTVTVGYHFAL